MHNFLTMMSRPAAAVLMAAVLVAVLSPSSEAAVSCSDVFQKLMPCLSYLQSGGNSAPPSPCCNGISALMTEATVKADRQTACNCLKRAAASVSGINFGLAGALPQRCGVNIPYKISPTTDCNKPVLILMVLYTNIRFKMN
ncbi:hypothetical protein IEQ34_013400 [Dendrobium chrysotoxum]|uniref:Non-specific lipid-transfer protein n=1 Tax=Dendrobium chrysotoxum TaxID=161865 RepID=A0AAV7G894_DENCH|nr:hypothetical protein IEQ34_013400 [Dendrobium chrysotoxum]